MAVYSTSSVGKDDGRDPTEQFPDIFGPGHPDQMIRQAIQTCWMVLPKSRRNVDELERQARRLFERALRDFREDRDAFNGAT